MHVVLMKYDSFICTSDYGLYLIAKGIKSLTDAYSNECVPKRMRYAHKHTHTSMPDSRHTVTIFALYKIPYIKQK